jgi:hypothetical protein
VTTNNITWFLFARSNAILFGNLGIYGLDEEVTLLSRTLIQEQ